MDDLVIIAVGLAGGAVAGWLISLLLKKKKYVEGLEERSQVYRLLAKILQNTSASRVLLFKTSNGSAVPRANSHYNTLILYEHYVHPMESIKEHYPIVSVDEELNRILIDVCKLGERAIDPNMLSRESSIRRIYEKEKVAYSRIYLVSEKSDHIVYLSVYVSVEDVGSFLTEGETIAVGIIVQQLKRIFKH